MTHCHAFPVGLLTPNAGTLVGIRVPITLGGAVLRRADPPRRSSTCSPYTTAYSRTGTSGRPVSSSGRRRCLILLRVVEPQRRQDARLEHRTGTHGGVRPGSSLHPSHSCRTDRRVAFRQPVEPRCANEQDCPAVRGRPDERLVAVTDGSLAGVRGRLVAVTVPARPLVVVLPCGGDGHWVGRARVGGERARLRSHTWTRRRDPRDKVRVLAVNAHVEFRRDVAVLSHCACPSSPRPWRRTCSSSWRRGAC